ncbi:SLAC1 anion channel family protein [Suttonella sp. R2A3]|uniref:SLAC1 anion channel family protein n=1 Tax=Suttonella sp. R2A3 TaxID=2908648 RepID=UPI001F3DDF9D|nr:SLAC1 anion channel family protein [Suttonella sp. R2A3]UJF24158.1 SLAC1 anion channel family protein [Suttonella sp. R2A3]
MSQPMRLPFFPISMFAVIMGFAGLTIASQRIEQSLSLNWQFSPILIVLSAALFFLISVIYALKIIKHPQVVTEEFNHPIRLHFFPAFSISLLLFSIILLPIQTTASLTFWLLGSVVHLALTLKIITMWIQNAQFELKHMNPSWFIPAVGNIIVPIAGITHAPADISWLFFSIGLVFWLILLVIFFNRIIFHHPLPEKLLPTFFILLAPPAIGFIAYMKLNGEQLDAFARVLYFFGIFILMLLIMQLSLLRKVRFYLSWWAYSFPMAAITLASLQMSHATNLLFYRNLALVLYGILGVLIVLLSVRTLIAIYHKEICIEEE